MAHEKKTVKVSRNDSFSLLLCNGCPHIDPEGPLFVLIPKMIKDNSRRNCIISINPTEKVAEDRVENFQTFGKSDFHSQVKEKDGNKNKVFGES